MMRRILFLVFVGALSAASIAAFSPNDINQVTLSNDTGYDIIWLFVTPADAGEIGVDVLEQDILADGDSFDLLAYSHTEYHILAIDEDFDYFEKTVDLGRDKDMSFTMSDFEGHYGDRALVQLNVTNDLGSWDVEHLFISPATSGWWGVDLLDAETIMAPNDTLTFAVEASEALSVDLLAIDEDGDTLKAELDFSAVAPGDSEQYDFDLTFDYFQ